LLPASTECRAVADACDVAETCDGDNATCPPDGFVVAGVECRGAADLCDASETCTGSAPGCPVDAPLAAGTECRPAASACDFAENCDGSALSCPADVVEVAGTVCRTASDACDPEEVCDGTSGDCPADVDADADDDMVCDGDDLCPLDADPFQDDADGDGRGDACDPCNNIVPVFASSARLRVRKIQTPPGDDILNFKGWMDVPTEPTIDPVTKGVRIIVESNQPSAAPVLDAMVPGGEGWKANKKGDRWRFRATDNPDGVVKVKMKLGRKRPGLRFLVKVKGGDLPIGDEDLPLKGTFIVDAPQAFTGQCGEAFFQSAAPDDRKNRCTMSKSGNKVRCRQKLRAQ
jgi:hypothetical protein